MITVLLLSQFRGSKKGKNTAFRESFGQPGQLRSFCKQGTPVGALTGTADPIAQDTINKVLDLAHAFVIFNDKCIKNTRSDSGSVHRHS